MFNLTTGTLQPEDVVELLASLNPPTTLTKNEARAALLQLDKDRNGSIDFQELSLWFTGENASATNPSIGATESHNPLQDSQQQQQQQQQNVNTPLRDNNVNPEHQMMYKIMTGGSGILRAITLCIVVAFTLNAFVMIFIELFYSSNAKGHEKGVWFFQFILECILTLMGLLAVLLEGRFTLCGTNCTLAISRNARLLNRVWGRGVYYLFLSTIGCGVGTMTELQKDTGTILTGLLLLTISIINIVIGCMAQAKLANLGEITCEEATREFHAADADNNGYLDTTELSAVLEKLGIQLGRTQLESAYVQIDVDGDGKITEREFVAWTQRSEVTDIVETRVNGEGSAQH